MMIQNPTSLMKSSLNAVVVLLSVWSGTTLASEDLTLDQVQKQLHGGDLTKPSPDSAVGKYLAETGASWVVRKFPNAPVGSQLPAYALGEEKLVVAVGPDSFESFKKHFTSQNFLYQVYEPNGMSMVAGFEGKRGTEGMLRDDMNYQVAGTLMIPILLDSQEGARTKQFFNLAEVSSKDAASPWRLRNQKGEAYSAISAFMGCTHWFGGVPIGNDTVESYTFPAGDADPTGDKPNQKKLTEYVLPAAYPENVSKLIHQVWTVPGHKQLGEILNPAAFRRGEFANTGWSVFTLIGSVSVERVPVVFVQVDDEKAPLKADFALSISAL